MNMKETNAMTKTSYIFITIPIAVYPGAKNSTHSPAMTNKRETIYFEEFPVNSTWAKIQKRLTAFGLSL